MLRLSKLTDYATVILSFMAQKEAAVHTSVEVAQATGLGEATVRKLLKKLAQAGGVVSLRGAKGGYRLARPAEQITVAWVIDVLEGPVALTECSAHGEHCEQAQGCQIQGVWEPINRKIQDALESVTVADLAWPKAPVDEVLVPVASLYR
ncbi:MAG: SUF system Fe-S cluster assembly regulator [Methylococcales bacterium]|nr:SUF system Fe-S cluster assembly regulator [Methylococcales bacterium]